jgi:uncharacterized membrane protein
MKDQPQLGVFFKSLTPLSWACLVITFASLAISTYAWLPLQSHSQVVLFPMHLATMAALFCVFGTMAKHHAVAWRFKEAEPIKVSLPRFYWLTLVLVLLYSLSVFFGSALYYPHGVDLGPAVNLRIFASGWLFLSVAGLGFSQWAGLRLRAYRAAA